MDRLRSAFGNVLWFQVESTSALATPEIFDGAVPSVVSVNPVDNNTADGKHQTGTAKNSSNQSPLIGSNYGYANCTTSVGTNVAIEKTPLDVTVVVYPYEVSDSEEKYPLLELPLTTGTKLGDEFNEPSCLSVSLYSAFAIGFICVFLVAVRGYVKYLLISLQETNLWLSILIFSGLFTIVSFPLTWGYILLNVAAGYLYGVFVGIIIVMLCALCGLTIAHVIIRRFLGQCVMKRIGSKSVRAIMRVVESNKGFRIVVLSRLTPIPFGLQNALFAVSSISTPRYIVASIIGMFPTQGMHAYIGSTLRSMEEVISDSSGSGSLTAYLIFTAQLIVAIALLVYVIRRAKYELSRTVAAFDDSQMAKNHPSEGTSLTFGGSEKTAQKRHSPKNSYGDAQIVVQ